MSYQRVNSRGVEYAVDWDIVERLCRSYWLTYYQLSLAETVDASESTWGNPLSWSMPTIRNVEVPWDKTRDAVHAATFKDMLKYGGSANSSMRDIAEEMKWRVSATSTNKRRFVEYLRDVQSGNVRELEQADQDYNGLIEALRFVRDGSADFVAIGSTIATGGQAAALLRASAALKAVGKYQDTASAGAAALYGTGSMVLGVFKIGNVKIPAAGEYALIIVQGVLETGTTLVAGESFAEAVKAGGLKIASAGAAQGLFGREAVKAIFKRIPVPFKVVAVTQRGGVNVTTNVANEFLEKTAKKVTEKTAKAGLVGAGKPATRRQQAGLADQAPLDDIALLNWSIVNMNKGVGRGW